MNRSGEAVDSWVSEKHVIQLHDTWIDLQDQKHSLGGELLEPITDWLGDRKLVSATGRRLGGRRLISRGQLFGLPMHVGESCMQDF